MQTFFVVALAFSWCIYLKSKNKKANLHAESTPHTRVVIVIVIDQFSAHYLTKLRPYLKGGIHFLAQNGINYLNAFYDNAMPTTAPGHTLLSTGTYGSVHGIISNKWLNAHGMPTACDDDTAARAAVFNPEQGGLYTYGKSARNCLVDNLSDQLILHSYPHADNQVWSLSLKSRAAIALAGRLGKALWMDKKTGLFTSSKAYFNELPTFVQEYNKKLSGQKYQPWHLMFSPFNPAYHFENSDNYTAARFSQSLINTPIAPHHGKSETQIYESTPSANQELLDLAFLTFKKNYKKAPTERFILWLGLSDLDKVGHFYGPESREALDTIYQIDAQLKKFINSILFNCSPK